MNQEFSCCAFFEQCDYGRNECVFTESEPGKKVRCRCYKLKHNQSVDNEGSEQVMVEIEEKDSFEKQPLETEQLSLF